jgi:hypothetical protein
MGLIGNEVSAANQQGRIEELSRSPVEDVLESGGLLAGASVALGTSLVAGGPVGLAVAGSVVAGMGIVDWFRKLGTTKVEENLEALGQATEDAFNRVERLLAEQGKSIDEIKNRFESDELKQAMASASLHALRTTEEKRIKRLALILANGVKDNDLTPESTDDMMRAAVELTKWDIFVLGRMYDSQKSLLSGQRWSYDWSQQIGHVWTDWNRIFGLGEDQHLKVRSALSRLQSLGLVAEVQTNFVKDGSLARQAFGLLPEGANFCERLQEISAQK